MSKLKSFKVDVSINAAKGKIWDALYTRFGETQLFNPNIISSQYLVNNTGELGCERECMLDSRTYVKEKIISYFRFRYKGRNTITRIRGTPQIHHLITLDM